MTREIKVNREYPVIPENPGETGGVALEVIVEGGVPVTQFIYNEEIFIPEDKNPKIKKLQEDLELERFLNMLAKEYDNINDSSNLSDEQKIFEGLRLIGMTMRSPYVGLHLNNSKNLAPVTEIVKPNGDFVLLKEYNPKLPEYFSMLRETIPELALVETEREKFIEYHLPTDQKKILKGYGITASLKPGNKLIGTIQLLNRASQLTKNERRILETNIRYFDSLVAHILHQGGEEWKRDDELLRASFAGLDESMHMELGASFTGAAEEKKTEEKKPKEDVVDKPGVGYCKGSWFELNKDLLEKRFESLKENLKEIGLDIERIFEEAPGAAITGLKDYKLSKQIAMTLDAVLSNIKVNESINGKIIFKDEDSKKEKTIAAMIVGASCLVPKYIEPFKTELKEKREYSDFTSQLNNLLKMGEKEGLEIDYYSQTGGKTIKTKIKWSNPAIKDYVLYISEYLDGTAGNNTITDVVEGVINFVDSCLETNYSAPTTVKNSLLKLKNSDYGPFYSPIARVVLPKKDIS